MKTIGVIGAGVMGRGVAQNLAKSGFWTIVIDVSEDILAEAREEIERSVRLGELFSKSEGTEDIETIMSRIIFTTEYQKLQDADFVIENVPEKLDIKKNVYRYLDKICKEDCIFLVNTSCISITKIAALTGRAEKVIGTHFMNPVPMKSVIEVIKGYHTCDATIESTKALLSLMGKETILVNDLPGFVSNRLSHLLMNEAAFVVQDQVATPQAVDDIFKKCFGHKMGPLETADLIGLDTVVDSLEVLYESYQDTKFRCCPLLKKMVDAGYCGRKTGKGFYNYSF